MFLTDFTSETTWAIKISKVSIISVVADPSRTKLCGAKGLYVGFLDDVLPAYSKSIERFPRLNFLRIQTFDFKMASFSCQLHMQPILKHYNPRSFLGSELQMHSSKKMNSKRGELQIF